MRKLRFRFRLFRLAGVAAVGVGGGVGALGGAGDASMPSGVMGGGVIVGASESVANVCSGDSSSADWCNMRGATNSSPLRMDLASVEGSFVICWLCWSCLRCMVRLASTASSSGQKMCLCSLLAQTEQILVSMMRLRIWWLLPCVWQ